MLIFRLYILRITQRQCWDLLCGLCQEAHDVSLSHYVNVRHLACYLPGFFTVR